MEYDKSYIKKNLIKEYEEELMSKRKQYISEREQRIKEEQEELKQEQERMNSELERKEMENRKLKNLQYNDYITGLKEREKKIQQAFEYKLKPMNVTLPMNSDEMLRNYHNKIYKLSEKADRNRRLFMEYTEKAKNNRC